MANDATGRAPLPGGARRVVIGAVTAVVTGALVGGAVRIAASGPSAPELAAAAMTVVLAAAVTLGSCVDVSDRPIAGRLAGVGQVALVTWGAAAAAGLVAGGGSGAFGAALVVASVAALGLGLAAALRRVGAAHGIASFGGAGLACVPAALLFVADPWIEWQQGSSLAPQRAALVLAANPLASMTSNAGGLGVDFQRMPWLYDGPDAGVPGLSLVGQYYPSVPPAAVPWACVALAAGAVLVALSGRTR